MADPPAFRTGYMSILLPLRVLARPFSSLQCSASAGR